MHYSTQLEDNKTQGALCSSCLKYRCCKVSLEQNGSKLKEWLWKMEKKTLLSLSCGDYIIRRWKCWRNLGEMDQERCHCVSSIDRRVHQKRAGISLILLWCCDGVILSRYSISKNSVSVALIFVWMLQEYFVCVVCDSHKT